MAVSYFERTVAIGTELTKAQAADSHEGDYDGDAESVAAGTLAPAIRDVIFDLREFQKDIDGCNAKLEGALDGR